ncbi:MAG: ACT domain-containing protein [Erysipelotrichaceae bacterium]|nr:ACT domain-containing protein [Erysipelotrichaceae bacterium]
MTKYVITVVGRDTVGIIAKVCTFLAEEEVNVLDISQTIVNGYFNMMMIVDAQKIDSFNEFQDRLLKVGEEIGCIIHCQHEDIFNMMHRI